MVNYRYIPYSGTGIRNYLFKVVMSKHADGWIAGCPLLERYGAVVVAPTQQEALRRINMRLHAVVHALVKEGTIIPGQVLVSADPLVLITTGWE